MMEEYLCFSIPELWYPYSEPRVALVYQDSADDKEYFADNFANSPNYPRLDGLELGS